MKKSIIVLLHIGYWAVYAMLLVVVFVGLLFRMEPRHDLGYVLFQHPMGIMTTVPNIIAFYVFYFWVFPNYLAKRKLWQTGLSALTGAMVSAIIGLLMLVRNGLGSDQMFQKAPELVVIFITMVLIALVHGSIALVIRGFIAWYDDLKIKEALTKKNFEMELALVKAQINPHFLFNTINNIDVLITKDAPKASQYLNQLSDIMRFMLYETKAERIPLQKELDYLEQYIALQKIRTSVPDYVQYRVSGDADGRMIAPMLLIPFVENAFKHADNVPKSSGGVNISIDIKPDGIYFECSNKYQPGFQENPEFSGLGNDLIGKRLTLLYPKQHTLNIQKTVDTYAVKLVIASHEN